MKSDIPPEYTNRPGKKDDCNDLDDLPPDFSTLEHPHQLPAYFQTMPTVPGWTIVINNRFWVDGFRIFISLDSARKFSAFKNSANPDVISLQEQGFGVPVFKAITNSVPFLSKYITFRKYTPTNLRPFDVDRDYFEFCVVRRYAHVGYDTYVFEFHPDLGDKTREFTLMMFSHSQLPIHDYLYKGVKHRWVDETHGKGFRKRWSMKFGFKHTILDPAQPALTDNWDGKSDKLDKEKKKNAYLGGYLRNMFSVSAKYAKAEYYGPLCSDTLGEEEHYFTRGFAELRVDDVGNPDLNVNYETIFSLKEDDLVSICVATVLKRQKDIEEQNRRSSNGGGGG
ncbi:hypothetical protein Cantr_07390 [Candida viswanathii]|uniref:Uncharacterized protein n=1 Tax=Candida viswanathii TaxID=5486 RepID=A0A367Y1Z3_9ASCO|nr:hypothetical protein Cantr_07390 [Candida viswanathii]